MTQQRYERRRYRQGRGGWFGHGFDCAKCGKKDTAVYGYPGLCGRCKWHYSHLSIWKVWTKNNYALVADVPLDRMRQNYRDALPSINHEDPKVRTVAGRFLASSLFYVRQKYGIEIAA